jgi:hypothetical protein
MDARYNFEEKSSRIGTIYTVTDNKSAYKLTMGIGDDSLPTLMVFFDMPSINKSVDSVVGITARDYDTYCQMLNNRNRLPQLNPNLQYIEIGAGLGGYIPELIKRYKKELTSIPIVIDPVDYQILHSMLLIAKDKKLPENLHGRINELLFRCDLYMNPSEVNLIPLSLQEAISSHPEIHGIGDIIIDLNAVSLYDSISEGKKNILDMLIKLRKDGVGKIFVN